MKIVSSFFLIICIISFSLISGCTQNANGSTQGYQPTSTDSSITSPIPTVTKNSSSQSVVVEPTGCVLTASGCIPIPTSPTVPPSGESKMQNEPIVGSFIFEKSQFKSGEIYYSTLGKPEYDFKVVPLDHSPDIKWTFRDDGVVLFYDRNSGNLLRTGTWTKTDSTNSKTEYQIKRGNWYYKGIYDKNGFRIILPDFWNMTKIS